MTQRSSGRGGPVKARRRKTTETKLRNKPKGVSPLNSRATNQETEIARLSSMIRCQLRTRRFRLCSWRLKCAMPSEL
jgi:hypothetical protein